jgi:hypothetical protein
MTQFQLFICIIGAKIELFAVLHFGYLEALGLALRPIFGRSAQTMARFCPAEKSPFPGL